jgi:cytochrome c-type biogenesis protein CcmH/NrfG
MAITFFKTPKNKQFNYKPVYYDSKEEERKDRLKGALEEEGEDYEIALRRRMQARWKRNSGVKDKKTSNTRLIVIILALVLITYWIFFR